MAVSEMLLSQRSSMKVKLTTQQGFTLLELLITFAMVASMLGIVAVLLPEMVNPAQNGAAQVAGFIKKARARAISTTSYLKVTPASTNGLSAERVSSCAAGSGDQDTRMNLELPQGVVLTNISWSICFNPRGFSDIDTTIPLEDIYDGEQQVEVFIGGAVRIL